MINKVENLSIRHLRAFVQVSQVGSFTQAASQLHVTQSSLTATIKQLEQQVGLKLLDRTTRRVLLSVEGERFMPVARQLISNFDTAMSDLKAIAAGQSGKISLAASPSIISQLMPKVIAQFQPRYPGISLALHDHNAAIIEQQVLDNEVDFGLGGNHSNQADLNYQLLMSDRYGLVVPDAHPLASHNVIGWQQIRKQNLIQLTSDTGIRAQLSRNPEQLPSDIDFENPLLEVSNPAALAEMIRSGLGISVLPELAASTRQFAELKFIPLNAPLISRDVYLISRKGRALVPAAETLIELVKETVQKQKFQS